MIFSFPHSAFTSDDFLGRNAVFVPEVLAAGFVSESDMAGFLSDPATAGLSAPAGTSIIRVTFALGVEDVNLGGDVVPQGVMAHAGCASSDVLGVRNKDSLYIDGATYRVLKIQPDETGWTTLLLGKRFL